MSSALLTDISKVFDCLNHKLLTAKLNAYGFTLPALKLIYNYLSNRKQRVRVNDSNSLEDSILGPLLFNIFLADLCFTLNNTEIANYADDTTLYAVSDNIDDLISSMKDPQKICSNGLIIIS